MGETPRGHTMCALGAGSPERVEPLPSWPPWAIIVQALKTTRYFEEQVLRKRPYIRREWCEDILRHPFRSEKQPDGRIRYWGFVSALGGRALRVVTLEDGETVLNAFPDRDFKVG